MTGANLSPDTRMVEALVQLEKAQEQLDDEHLTALLVAVCDDIDWALEERDRHQKQGLDQ